MQDYARLRNFSGPIGLLLTMDSRSAHWTLLPNGDFLLRAHRKLCGSEAGSDKPGPTNPRGFSRVGWTVAHLKT